MCRYESPKKSLMKASLLIFCAVFSLFAGGCSVGPNYHPPKVNASGQWGEPLAGGVTNREESLGAWWKNFHDAELDSLIERAVKTNLDLRIAEARVRQARAQQSYAKADFGPTANASGSYTRQKQSKNQPIIGAIPISPDVPFENDVYQAGFDASWEIDIFGGKRRAAEAARANLSAIELNRRGVLVTLLSEVARNYVLTRGSQQQLAIALQQIRSQEATVSITQSRVDHGAATDLDLQRALALLATLQAQVPPIENSIETTMHRLGVLLNQPPDALQRELSVAAPIPSAPPEVPVGLPSDLLLRRPDVQSAERQLAAETARIGQTKADLFPKFFLTGSAGLTSVSTSDFFVPGSRTWSIGPTVKWRIFDAGRVCANIRAQTAVRDQACLNYEATILNSLEDAENSLVVYAKEQEHRHWLDEAVTANQKAVDIASQLYDKGLGNYLNLLDAQRALYSAEDELVRSERAVSVNLIALYKALDGGWEAEPAFMASMTASTKTIENTTTGKNP
jgi:NodT family efflux transporter outer membrane factor (OMF) lipoprotein